jgi:hypothetical protein
VIHDTADLTLDAKGSVKILCDPLARLRADYPARRSVHDHYEVDFFGYDLDTGDYRFLLTLKLHRPRALSPNDGGKEFMFGAAWKWDSERETWQEEPRLRIVREVFFRHGDSSMA